jgi:hypothetical protein
MEFEGLEGVVLRRRDPEQTLPGISELNYSKSESYED